MSSFRGGPKRFTLKSIRPSQASLSRHGASCIGWIVPRGGSTEEEADEYDESDSEEETDSDVDEDEASDEEEDDET